MLDLREQSVSRKSCPNALISRCPFSTNSLILLSKLKYLRLNIQSISCLSQKPKSSEKSCPLTLIAASGMMFPLLCFSVLSVLFVVVFIVVLVVFMVFSPKLMNGKHPRVRGEMNYSLQKAYSLLTTIIKVPNVFFISIILIKKILNNLVFFF